jgi:hypothetical protein
MQAVPCALCQVFERQLAQLEAVYLASLEALWKEETEFSDVAENEACLAIAMARIELSGHKRRDHKAA